MVRNIEFIPTYDSYCPTCLMNDRHPVSVSLVTGSPAFTSWRMVLSVWPYSANQKLAVAMRSLERSSLHSARYSTSG